MPIPFEAKSDKSYKLLDYDLIWNSFMKKLQRNHFFDEFKLDAEYPIT